MGSDLFACFDNSIRSSARPGSSLKRHQAKQSVFKKLKMKSLYLLSNFHSAVFTQATERRSPLTLCAEECIFAWGMHLLTSIAYMYGHNTNKRQALLAGNTVLIRYQVNAPPISPIPISIPILSTYKSSLSNFM